MEYTFDEYKKRLQVIDNERQKQVNRLNIEFANANNPYTIGDKVTDHNGTILIEKINHTAGAYNHLPSCVYFGLELKKDGKPRKDNNKRNLWQSNIETK